MTQHSRVVLEDCRAALADLKDGVQGSEWLRRYVAALALLRAVGHVLKKVDANASTEVKKAIYAEWRDLKEHKAEYEADPAKLTAGWASYIKIQPS